MTGLPIQPIDEELQTLQREVQRMLGRCLLRLQQYEQLMKAIVAHHEISASGSPLESNQAERIADAANKTLGTLVGTLLGTYVTSGEQDEVAGAAREAGDEGEEDGRLRLVEPGDADAPVEDLVGRAEAGLPDAVEGAPNDRVSAA